MGKYKECPKYNIISMRVTDEEKSNIEELKLITHKSVSMLLREAMNFYSPLLKVDSNRVNNDLRFE